MKYLSLLVLTLILAPTFVLAATGTTIDYVPLVTIPGVNTGDVNNGDLSTLINALYGLSISIAALLAVIKIVIAGVKWMTTDIVTSKGEAKKDIQGALLGLLVVLAAVLIITVINPDILTANMNLSKSTPSTKIATATGGLTVTPTSFPSFDSLPISTDPIQAKIFKDKCVSDGYKFNQTTGSFRCYKDVPPGKSVQLIDDKCTNATAVGTCPPIFINTTASRNSCVDAGGTWYIDPDHTPMTDVPSNVGGIVCYR